MNKNLLLMFILLHLILLVSNTEAAKCESGKYACNNDQCVLKSWTCDGSDDCGDNSDEDPKICSKKKACNKPTKTRHGLQIGSDYSVGNSVQFECNVGYHLIGSSKIICQPKGEWNGFKTKCIRRNNKKKYCKVPELPNGSIVGRKLSFRSRISYSCDNGYKLIGTTVRVCKRNGKWSGTKPYCDPLACPDPGIPKNGKRLNSDFLKGSSLRYKCNPEYELVGSKLITCLYDASWSDTIPSCLTPDEAVNRQAKDLKKNFVERLKLLTVDGRGRSALGLSNSAQGLDLVFVLDYSASVGKSNFRKSIAFTKSMIDEFGLSETNEGTHVAVILFADQPKLIFNLMSDKVYEKKIAIEKLENTEFLGGGTATRLALDLVNEKVVNETRKDAKKALFLLSDGKYNSGGDPAKMSFHLRRKIGYEIYTIGISESVEREHMERIASLPFATHIYMLKNFGMLEKLKDLLNNTKIDYRPCGIGGDTQIRNRVNTSITTKHGAWPWVVTVFVSGRMACVGTLLDEQWIITAASCLDGEKANTLRIIIGSHHRTNQNKKGSEQKRQVKKVLIHPEYSKETGNFDIALLQLRKKAKLNEFSRSICLPNDHDRVYIQPRKKSFVIGWGGKSTVYLEQHQGQVTFAFNGYCKKRIDNFNPRQQICVGRRKPNGPLCAGSIGSPLLVQRRRFLLDKRQIYSWALIGVMNRNDGCHLPSYSVFTSIFSVNDWIQDTMKNVQ